MGRRTVGPSRSACFPASLRSGWSWTVGSWTSRGRPANRQPGWPALVLGIVRSAPLEPVAAIETERERRVFGAVEVSDDRVSSSIDGIPGPSFRQIELEMKGSGAGRLLRELSDRLMRAGAKPTAASKLETALGGQPEPEVAVPRLRPRSRLDTLVGYALSRSVIRLIGEDPKIRAGSDADPVHDARVATRRLRSDLKTLEPYLSPVEGLRTELGWLGGLLGEVRDLGRLARAHARADRRTARRGPGRRGRDPREARRRSSSATRRAPRWARLRQVSRARGRTDRSRWPAPRGRSCRPTPCPACASSGHAEGLAPDGACGRSVEPILAGCGAARGPQASETSALRSRAGPRCVREARHATRPAADRRAGRARARSKTPSWPKSGSGRSDCGAIRRSSPACSCVANERREADARGRWASLWKAARAKRLRRWFS